MNDLRNDASLHEILSAVCDETATAEQIERLAEILQSDPAARRFYVRYLDMHGRLNTLPALEDDAADAPHAQRIPAWRWPAVAAGVEGTAGNIRPLVITRLPVPLMATATNTPFPYAMARQSLSTAAVCACHVMPSGLVITTGRPASYRPTATNCPSA